MLYHIRVRFPFDDIDFVLPFFEDKIFDALSWYECPESEPSRHLDENGFPIAQWFWVEAVSKQPIDNKQLDLELCLLKGTATGYEVFIDPLPNVDWQEKVYESIQPFMVNRFYIHHDRLPAHERGNNYKIGLNIRAATAFGSGEHPTTYTCLKAIDDIKKMRPYISSCLDMGCGSGILAIAAKKIWPSCNVVAVDIDNEAVNVTKKNATDNNVSLNTFQSIGFQNSSIIKCAPYNVIIANILAKPLIEMAPLFSSYLSASGYLVLSGLLKRQAPLILNAFRLQGLTLYKSYELGDWQTLVLIRND